MSAELAARQAAERVSDAADVRLHFARYEPGRYRCSTLHEMYPSPRHGMRPGAAAGTTPLDEHARGTRGRRAGAEPAAAMAGGGGLLHAGARHHHPQHRRARHRARPWRGAAQHEGGAGQLHAQSRGVHPGERLDGQSLRHAARVRRRHRPVRARLAPVRPGARHPPAGGVPHPAGLRRGDDGAGRTADAGARVRQIAAGARDELRRHPEPRRADARTRRRWR